MYVISEWSRPIYQGDRKQILLFVDYAEAVKVLSKVINKFPNAVITKVKLEQDQ